MAIKYKWLCERLKETIRKNIAAGIDRLPTEEALCQRYHLSRQTVRQALNLLEQEGLILRVKGSGTYITGLLENPEENRIAILITESENYLYPALLFDIRNELNANNFTTQVFVTENSVYTERLILETLLTGEQGNWRGIIVEGCKSALPNPNLDLYAALEAKGVHILFLYSGYTGLQLPCIKDDNLLGSHMLAQHLWNKGHRNIAGIFQSDAMQGIERYQGFVESMRDFGAPVPDNHIGWFRSEELDTLRTRHDTRFLTAFLQDILDDCTAILCYNDEIAYWLATELRLAGHSIPDEIALVSFDNSYLSNSEAMPITGLAHELHETGRTVAREMLKKCKGLPAVSQTIPWKLVIKKSS